MTAFVATQRETAGCYFRRKLIESVGLLLDNPLRFFIELNPLSDNLKFALHCESSVQVGRQIPILDDR